MSDLIQVFVELKKTHPSLDGLKMTHASLERVVDLKMTHPSLDGLKMTHASLERVVELKMTHPSLEDLKMTHPSLEKVENDESFLSKSSSAFLKFPESFRIQKTKKGCQTSSKS